MAEVAGQVARVRRAGDGDPGQDGRRRSRVDDQHADHAGLGVAATVQRSCTSRAVDAEPDPLRLARPGGRRRRSRGRRPSSRGRPGRRCVNCTTTIVGLPAPDVGRVNGARGPRPRGVPRAARSPVAARPPPAVPATRARRRRRHQASRRPEAIRARRAAPRSGRASNPRSRSEFATTPPRTGPSRRPRAPG